MRKRWGAVTAAGLTALSLGTASPAPAASEVGSRCLANGSASDFTLLQIEQAPGSPLPLTAPASGVVTKWRVNSGLTSVLAENLRVFRATGGPNEFQAIADSRSEPIVPGENVFDTRIPVRAGDRFGAYAASPSGALYCTTADPADVMGAVHFNAAVGTTQAYTPNANFQVALSAVVEPDADGDGYGDETQDQCPKGAAYQGKCPHVTLGVVAVARKRSILLRVRGSSEASVHVFGQVGWGIRPKPRRDAGRSRGKTRLIVGLSGGTKNVAPGRATRFRIQLPKAVLRRLGRLTPRESLKAKITAQATDLAGRVTNRRLTVKLKGHEGAGGGYVLVRRSVRSPTVATLPG
jgi:hypothetical protein